MTTTVRSGPAGAHLEEAQDLGEALRRGIRGEVRFDMGSRALYATDLSMYRQVPIGVVVPHDIEDVLATVDACHQRGVPILGRGCGTSLAGQCCNVAVVIDFSKHLNRVLDIDPEQRVAWVEPGVICDQLRDRSEQHHLTFAADPATHGRRALHRAEVLQLGLRRDGKSEPINSGAQLPSQVRSRER
jgi:FAD/FMN-containing dehydrogenase